MLAAIDIHKSVFQAAVLDPEEGELVEQRFAASGEKLREWLDEWAPELETVAIEATTGWRWVARELQDRGIDVRLVDPGRASALQGRRAQAKTDRLDARWLVTLLANDMLPEAWIPPEEIQRLRDRTRLRKALANDHTRWAQRLHAILVHEGSGASRGQLLTASGRQRLAEAELDPVARMQVDAMLAVMGTITAQIEAIDVELRAIAAADERCQGLVEIFGVGPILATTILAEIGAASRFRRSRQVVRLAGLDPIVRDSAEKQRRGRLSKQGAPCLRWALVEAAQHACRKSSPDHELYLRTHGRAGANPATLTVARKLAKRAFHVLRSLEPAAEPQPSAARTPALAVAS